MAFGNSNNNNDKQPTNITYSAIGFSNPNGKVAQSKLNISYFNKLLKVGIADKKQVESNNGYDTYDNENQAVAYISATKARILLYTINEMLEKDDVFNASVEIKNGLITVSDGSEFGADNYCICISVADDAGNIDSKIYETKSGYNNGITNYRDGEYSKVDYPRLELESFMAVLEEYVRASTYAVAASVMEASMYKRNAATEVLYNIGRKVGVLSDGNNTSNQSFFARTGANAGSSKTSIPDGVTKKDYELSTFDDIANG